jgi:hypothetical protein
VRFIVVSVTKERLYSFSKLSFNDFIYQISGGVCVRICFEPDGVAANISEILEDSFETGTL